jgi:hypothetical protein
MADRTIADYGINWIWYLCGDFDESAKTVHIHYHQRWHKAEGGHPQAERPILDRVDIIESTDGKRTATAVELNGIVYTVTNPMGVFSYGDMSHYVAEAGNK